MVSDEGGFCIFAVCFTTFALFFSGMVKIIEDSKSNLTCNIWNPNNFEKDKPSFTCIEIQNFSNYPQPFQDNGNPICYCISLVNTVVKSSCC